MTAASPISTAGEWNRKTVDPPGWGDSMRASIAAASGAIFALASTRCVRVYRLTLLRKSCSLYNV
jgi:hypothetical protein